MVVSVERISSFSYRYLEAIPIRRERYTLREEHPSELFTINRFNAEADTAVQIDDSGSCQDPMYPTLTFGASTCSEITRYVLQRDRQGSVYMMQKQIQLFKSTIVAVIKIESIQR